MSVKTRIPTKRPKIDSASIRRRLLIGELASDMNVLAMPMLPSLLDQGTTHEIDQCQWVGRNLIAAPRDMLIGAR